MYQTIEGFLQSWKYEAESTQKMLDALTDESLSQEIAPEHWTLGQSCLAYRYCNSCYSIRDRVKV